jgi:hypothetical protein
MWLGSKWRGRAATTGIAGALCEEVASGNNSAYSEEDACDLQTRLPALLLDAQNLVLSRNASFAHRFGTSGVAGDRHSAIPGIRDQFTWRKLVNKTTQDAVAEGRTIVLIHL